MNLVHTLQTADHEPLSHAGRYLYEYHGQLESFLRRKYGARYENLLARPDLIGQRAVQWFSALNPPLTRLADLREEKRVAMKRSYWEARADIDRDIAELEQSREKDRRDWGALMRAVFNDENNIILSNGKEWCLLWGWTFRNRENYLAPEFMVPPAAPAGDQESDPSNEQGPPPTADPAAQPEEMGPPTGQGSEAPQATRAIIAQLPVDDAGTLDDSPNGPREGGIGDFMARAWRWMLLVLVLLYLACMLKCCARRNAEAECVRMDRLHERVDSIEQRVQENCETPRP
jgi:hypothetical protein